MKYHYDQIYPYVDILKEVKEMLWPTILERINIQDIENTGLTRTDLTEIVYSHIMALGYNEQNIDAALADLMPTRNSMLYQNSNEEDGLRMALNLSQICVDFKFQVMAFQTFHHMTMDLKPHKDIILEVKKTLLFA